MPDLDCANCPLRRQPLFVQMTPEEVAFMRRFKIGERVLARGQMLVRQDETSPSLYTVLSGMGTRSVLLENGRRQVINFVLPGDLTGLQAGLMGEAKHSVTAATDMVVCVFSRDRLWEMFRDHPARAYDMTWIAAVEEHFLGETIATLGQRDATERVAWALARLWRRLAAVGLARGSVVPLPFRQHDLADAVGLSLVHTNKTMARLREMGVAEWSGGRLTVPDLQRLADVAGQTAPREETRPIF